MIFMSGHNCTPDAVPDATIHIYLGLGRALGAYR